MRKNRIAKNIDDLNKKYYDLSFEMAVCKKDQLRYLEALYKDRDSIKTISTMSFAYIEKIEPKSSAFMADYLKLGNSVFGSVEFSLSSDRNNFLALCTQKRQLENEILEVKEKVNKLCLVFSHLQKK